MSVTINGTTGLAGVDGSAGTPAVQGSDTNTGIFFPAADTVGVTTGGSERMRVDSSGNVGIGTSSPSTKLHVVGEITATQGVGGTPAFSAYRATSNQSVSSNTWTKAQLNAEDFDTASAFDSTTNYRFTPQVAGYYQINGSIASDSTSSFGTGISVALYKNGSLYRVGTVVNTSAGTASTPTVACVVYFNGSTDYVEIYGYFAGGVGMVFSTSNNSTSMSGALIRGA